MGTPSKIFQLSSVLKQAIQEDDELHCRHLLVLLIIAQKEGTKTSEGVSQTEICGLLNLTSGGISKIVSKLGRWRAHQVPGLDWVKLHEDPVDRRFKLLALTEKGKKFVKQLENSM